MDQLETASRHDSCGTQSYGVGRTSEEQPESRRVRRNGKQRARKAPLASCRHSVHWSLRGRTRPSYLLAERWERKSYTPFAEAREELRRRIADKIIDDGHSTNNVIEELVRFLGMAGLWVGPFPIRHSDPWRRGLLHVNYALTDTTNDEQQREVLSGMGIVTANPDGKTVRVYLRLYDRTPLEWTMNVNETIKDLKEYITMKAGLSKGVIVEIFPGSETSDGNSITQLPDLPLRVHVLRQPIPLTHPAACASPQGLRSPQRPAHQSGAAASPASVGAGHRSRTPRGPRGAARRMPPVAPPADNAFNRLGSPGRTSTLE